MAHFRGTLQGGRGQASRLGNRTSGLMVEAASWQGKVHVELTSENGVDYAHVVLRTHHGAGRDLVLYSGPVSGEGAKAALFRAAQEAEPDGVPIAREALRASLAGSIAGGR